MVNAAGAYLQSVDIQGAAPGVILNAGGIRNIASAKYLNNGASGYISLANAATIVNNGLIYNATASTITNAKTISSATATIVTNTGTIGAVADHALASDTVTNSGTIGTVQNGQAGTLENQGFVSTASYSAVVNQQGGTIVGVSAATVDNAGIILGNINAYNVSGASQSVLNSGTVKGNVTGGNLTLQAVATVENSGYIGGNVYIEDGVFIETPDAVVKGKIVGHAYNIKYFSPADYHSTLELAAGAQTGTINGFSSLDNVIFDNGSQWVVKATSIALFKSGPSQYNEFLISNFAAGDTIDITSLALGATGDTFTYGVATTGAHNGAPVLSFENGSHHTAITYTYVTGQGEVRETISVANTYTLGIAINTSITNPNFVFTSDGQGGTDITVEGTIVPQSLVTLGSAAHPGYSYTLGAGQDLYILGANAILAGNTGGAAGTVSNFGTIEASPQRDAKSVIYGISLANGGVVTNAAGAYLQGAYIQGTGNPGILLNAGTVGGTVKANDVTNSATGYISFASAGTIDNSGHIYAAAAGSAGTIGNSGTIGSAAAGSLGSIGNDGGMISTAKAGFITNSGVIYNATATIVTNTGTIGALTALGTDTVQNAGTIGTFTGGAAGTLDNQGYAGSVGGGGVINHETIGSLTGIATLQNDGVVLGSVQGASKASLVDNGGTIGGSAYGTTLINSGTIDGNAYGVSIVNTGTIDGEVIESTNAISGGAVFGYGDFTAGATDTSGVDLISTPNPGTLTILGKVNTVTFGSGSWMVEGGYYANFLSENKYGTRSYGTRFSNFGASDTIDVMGAGAPISGSATFVSGANTGYLYFATSKGQYRLDIASTAITNPNFVVTGDGANGVDVTEATVPCYLRGTLIRTVRGEVPVEELAIGDLVATAFGDCKPVKWIGHREYDARFAAGNHMVMPIRIAAHAIAPGMPSRDLFVSPCHAMYVDGVLVHAWRLINGVTITQEQTIERIAYYHVELDRHEVIFAENCPGESLHGAEFRVQFHNAAEFAALYPETLADMPALPRIEDGFVLDAVRRRLAARAGIPVQTPVPGALRGFVDQAGPSLVRGWAQDEAQPEQPVCLDILHGGRRIAQVLANRYRVDLRKAGLGSGCHAFEFRLPEGVVGPVEVRRTGDGRVLTITEAALALAA